MRVHRWAGAAAVGVVSAVLLVTVRSGPAGPSAAPPAPPPSATPAPVLPPVAPGLQRGAVPDLAGSGRSPSRSRPSPSASPSPSPRPAAPRVLAEPVPGADVSWPNCPVGSGIPERRTLGLPRPRPDAEFVVVGLTNGPAFTPNPCLRAQVARFEAEGRRLGAYAVTTFPTRPELARYGGAGSRLQRLQRVGRAQAEYDVERLREAGLRPGLLWVDVEPSAGRPWSADPAENLAVVGGVLAGVREAGLAVGLYTYAGGWQEITGGQALPDLPAWVPAGTRGRAEALRRCRRPSPAAGPVWLVQWTDGERDVNATCPGLREQAYRLFAR